MIVLILYRAKNYETNNLPRFPNVTPLILMYAIRQMYGVQRLQKLHCNITAPCTTYDISCFNISLSSIMSPATLPFKPRHVKDSQIGTALSRLSESVTAMVSNGPILQKSFSSITGYNI